MCDFALTLIVHFDVITLFKVLVVGDVIDMRLDFAMLTVSFEINAQTDLILCLSIVD